MNTHIKFKCLNTDYKEPIWELFDITDADALWRNIDKPILRYTGCTDVNGREIYEGDALGHRLNIVEFSFGCWNTNGDRPLSYQSTLAIVEK